MGLSSAQARLLTITARKSDCEFQSMNLSHQKLALSRDMENITDEYNNALNATKLVYDFYGTGASEMALSYGLLMTPSVYNDYSPRFVTDSTNRIILNSQLADALRACGIPREGLGGTGSSDMREAFIQALAQEGVLSAAQVQSIEATAYDNAAGLGYSTASDEAIENLTYEDLLEQLNRSATNNIKDYGLHLGDFYTLYSNGEEDWRLLSSRDHETSYDNQDIDWNKDKAIALNSDWARDRSIYSTRGDHARTGIYVKKSGTDTYKYLSDGKDNSLSNGTYGRDNNLNAYNEPIDASIKFTDLLTSGDQFTFAIDSYNGVVTDAAYMQILLCGDDDSKSVLNWMSDELLNALGDTNLNIQALEYARSCILDMIWPDDNIQNAALSSPTNNDVSHSNDQLVKNVSGVGCYNENNSNNILNYFISGSNNGHWINTVQDAENILGFCTYTDSGISVNLNNIAQVFMTAFVDYIQGMDNTNYSYSVGKKTDSILFNSNVDTDVVFEQLVGYNTDGADQTLATFYDTMFNIICTQGWVENGRIDDANYMQEMMKNGMVYFSTIGYDGYYHSSNYTTDMYVQEIADEDAIARAEAKYRAAKARIENKENTLDLKMKNLDTEITSLNQEYESAKTLIKNAVDKTFTRYS